MNLLPVSEPADALAITRREAIRRTALVLGVAITPSLLVGVLQAQPPTGKPGETPVYLSGRRYATAAAIAERLLPRTDTPGAGDVGVPAFIDLMFGKYLTENERGVLAAGLDDVERASMASTRRSFTDLGPDQQDAQLRTLAAAVQKQENTFFHLIKELTLLGYFTSEPIGKNVLHYDPIPGRFDGCIPLAEVGNVSWTR